MTERDLASFPERPGPLDFPRILEHFAASSMALAMNVLGNRQDAEDACQEAFFQVFRHLERFDNRAGFQTWLYTILHRRCIDMVRKRKRALRLFGKIRAEQKSACDGPRRPESPGRPLDPSILALLSPKERTALSLWANEGYSAEEIARVIGSAAGTARVHLYQARKKLKAFLENQNEALQNS